MSEEEFGELRSLAGGADALAHLGHGGSDGLGEVAVAVGAGDEVGRASMRPRQPMHCEGSFTRMLKGSMMSIGQTSAQRPHMRQIGSGMGTKPVFG